jgi:hypothetical protein
MPSLHPDRTQFTSLLPSYINVGNTSANMTITGSIANLNVANFDAIVSTTLTNNRVDLYARNLATNVKEHLAVNFFSNDTAPIGGVYQHVSSEVVQYSTALVTGGIRFRVSISNFSGGTITLTDQQIQFTIVQYQLPF